MESKDWAFERTVDRDFLDAHLELIEYVTLSLRQQMADHIFGLLQQDSAMCIQRGEMTMHNDDARRMVSFEETLRVRPLVRCGECKWFVKSEGVCYLLSNNYEPTVDVDEDDYCSRGERKGGDE